MLPWSDSLTCPYCDKWPDIDYEEDDTTSVQKCNICGSEFILHTRMAIVFATEELPK